MIRGDAYRRSPRSVLKPSRPSGSGLSTVCITVSNGMLVHLEVTPTRAVNKGRNP